MTDIDMPPPLPEGYVCPEGYVPGWLNADGLPTSCVGDAAVPGEPILMPPIATHEPFPPALPLDPLPVAPEVGVPVAVVPAPRELAETGFDPLTGMLFAGSVFLVGVAVLVARRMKGAKV